VEKTFGELNLGDVWSDIGGGEFRIRSESGCFNLLDNHFHTDEACYSYSAKVIHYPDAVIVLDGNVEGGE